MGFKIEKGVRLVSVGSKPSHYPFDEMSEGDSFLVTDEKLIQGLRHAASYWSRSKGGKLTIRRVDDGWRCWMLKEASKESKQ